MLKMIRIDYLLNIIFHYNILVKFKAFNTKGLQGNVQFLNYWTLLIKNTNWTTSERKPKINCLYVYLFIGEDFIWWFLGSEIGYFVVTLMVTSLVTLFSLLSLTISYLRWEFKYGKSRIWRFLRVLIRGSYKKENPFLPYGTHTI